MKQQKKSKVLEQVKASRKKSREEEITAHGKAINYRKVMASKKQYNRKKNKADDEVLPYFFSGSANFNSPNRNFGGIGIPPSLKSTKYLPVFLPAQTLDHQL